VAIRDYVEGKDARAEWLAKDFEERVREAIASSREPLSTRRLHELVGGRKQEFLVKLEGMLAAGKLRVKAGIRRSHMWEVRA